MDFPLSPYRPPFNTAFNPSTLFTRTSTPGSTILIQTTVFRESTTPTSSSRSWYSYATASGSPSDDQNGFLSELNGGTKAGIGVAVASGALIIMLLSAWYCCGCCGLRARRRKRLQKALPTPSLSAMNAPPPVALRDIQAGDAAMSGAADAPPPLYEEAVPPEHQYVAGGATYVREDDEQGIISDGKTPLSEIPFEDVVLDHSPSEGSARSFGERHHGLGGDTTGHVNS